MPEREERARHIRRILVVRLGAFGDIVLTMPAVSFLRRRFPLAEIDWLTEPAYMPFLRCLPLLRRAWTADTKRWRRRPGSLGELRELVRELRSERFDLAVDFQGLLKSALLARLSGAREVRGFGRGQVRESLAPWLYTSSPVTAPGKRHQLERHLDLVDPPLHRSPADPRVELEIPSRDEAFVERSLRERALSRPVLLNPGGGWPTKRWDPSRYGELAERIESQLGLPTLISFGPGEEPLAAAVQSGASRPVARLRTSMVELAALCRQSRLMVGGDTGPLHLAVAMGTPVVAILGPALAWKTGPFGDANLVVQHPTQCPHPYRRRCAEHFCMDISVDAVLEAVCRRLETES